MQNQEILFFSDKWASIPTFRLGFKEIQTAQPCGHVFGITKQERPLVLDIFVNQGKKSNGFHIYILASSESQKG